jgi:type II secretory pathway pseudopilin PulG
MRAHLTDERGQMSLIELLVAMTIFIGVLGATLFTFQNFDTLQRRDVSRAASQDSARTSVDRLARDLRNLASPTIEKPQAVDKATAYDLIFQTVDPIGPNTGSNSANIKRVRWCLDSSNPANEKLYMQEQTWVTLDTPVLPANSTCPSSGWTTTSVLVSSLTNNFAGQSRPLFAYDSTTLTAVREIHVDLYSDLDPAKTPNETHITTGVFLRNQNAAPIGAFSYALQGTSAIVLNGSQSYDPEGGALTYSWIDNGVKQNTTNVTYSLPVTPGSNHAIQLQVFDPSGLEGDSATINIKVPSSS